MYYFNVGCFSTKFTPELVNQWAEELGVESQSKILMPETELTDLDELKDNLEPEEYNKLVSGMTGKFIEVDKPLMAGYMTLEELYHKLDGLWQINSIKFLENKQQISESQKILSSTTKYRTV